MHATSKFRMAVSVVIGICLVLWGIPLAGQAQEVRSITRTQGILASVNLAGMTATLHTSAGQRVFTLTSVTVVRVGEELEFLDSLPPFVGAAAIVLSTDVDGTQVAGRVDILV